MSRKLAHRQARLLAWMLIFLVLFSTFILLILLVFNPQHNPACHQYSMLISGLIVFLTFAYVLNCAGHYKISATLLVVSAAIAPWASLLFDSSILRGDFVPLIYLVFSILLSSILLPTYVTFALATLQFMGIALVLALSPATVSFNWVSFLAFIFLTSVSSILTNTIIQRDMKQIESQAHQLALNETRLQELSIHDYLTNLFNRRYLEDTLQREKRFRWVSSSWMWISLNTSMILWGTPQGIWYCKNWVNSSLGKSDNPILLAVTVVMNLFLFYLTLHEKRQ